MFYFLKNLLYVIIVYYLIFKNLSNFKIFFVTIILLYSNDYTYKRKIKNKKMYENKKCKTIKIYFFLDVKIKKNPSVLFANKTD